MDGTMAIETEGHAELPEVQEVIIGDGKAATAFAIRPIPDGLVKLTAHDIAARACP
jgi:hypothetical protein